MNTVEMQASSTTSLSTWFNSIKSDDIDGGLAADFDGSLSGLGVELGSTTYNMSEALLALPVFKQESFEQGLKVFLEDRWAPTSPTAYSDYRGDNAEVSPQPAAVVSPLETYHHPNVRSFTPVFNSCCVAVRFTYILGASTSPATKVNEETLTYLNQGQSYEVKLKGLGDLGDLKGKLLRSKIRVVFHERRLQYMEKEQLDRWKNTRPGERILDIDIPLSYGICDIVVDPKHLNLIEFVWDPNKDVGVYCKVHSISTEFTEKKHGGEKGVPFRVQVETYALEPDNVEKLVHCASCQVKVFKPKGADRKNKTDKERIEKRSSADKDKYQPSYECTVLTEIPITQVQSYLDQLKKQELETCLNDMQIKKSISPSTATNKKHQPASAKSSDTTITKATSSLKIKDEVRNFAAISDSSNSQGSLDHHLRQSAGGGGGGGKKSGARGIGVPKTGLKKNKSAGSLPSPPLTEDTCSLKGWTEKPKILPNPHPPPPPPEKQNAEPLAITASASEVTEWLKTNRFQNFIKVFQNFSGADLLRLSREDLIQICGLADGIRLNNALQAKALRPKLTLYVCQMTIKQRMSTHQHSEHSTPSPSSSPGAVSMATSSSRAIPFISPPHFIPPETQETADPSIAVVYPTNSVATVTTVSGEELTKLQLGTSTAIKGGGGLAGTTISVAKAPSLPMQIPSGNDINSNLDALMKELVTQSSIHSTATRPSTEHINIISSSGAGSLSSLTATNTRGASVGEAQRHHHHPRRTSPCSSSKLSLTQSSKRQYREFNEDLDDSEVFYSKKQRTRNLELSKKGVYHALYLDHLTVNDLRDKMASLYSLQTAQVREVYVQGPSGIHVLVTDEVVQNFQDETRYFIEVTQDEESLGVYPEYYVYLKNST